MVKFELEKLPYEYDALSPYISEETLKLHHDKHHQTYCDKFNAALEELNIQEESFEEIFANVSNKPAIRNHGGGFWNHNFYWESMGPNSEEKPIGKIAELIDESFGSFENFKDEFSKSATLLFGSGWTWLAVNDQGKLVIYNTPNQDNYMMDICPNKEKPILVIDVWEHAYYVDYQNRRPEYIEQFFNVINWEKVEERLNNIL